MASTRAAIWGPPELKKPEETKISHRKIRSRRLEAAPITDPIRTRRSKKSLMTIVLDSQTMFDFYPEVSTGVGGVGLKNRKDGKTRNQWQPEPPPPPRSPKRVRKPKPVKNDSLNHDDITFPELRPLYFMGHVDGVHLSDIGDGHIYLDLNDMDKVLLKN